MLKEHITSLFEYRKDTIVKAKPIFDYNIGKYLSNINLYNENADSLIVNNQIEFVELYTNWILSSKIFEIKSLNRFSNRYITNGVTNAFDDFYFIHKNNITVLKGEYPYHRDIGFTVVTDIKDIPNNSGLIISYPFSATGNVHESWEEIIEYCCDNNISIFIDCCLFGVSSVDTLDLSHPCITHVAFSLSKIFGTGGARLGLMFTSHLDYTPISNQNKWFYTNMAGQIIHTSLLKNFSPDYIFNKYRSKQLEICNNLDIVPSNTVLFGLSSDDKWKEFNRDGYINRMCISYAIQEIQNPLEFG